MRGLLSVGIAIGVVAVGVACTSTKDDDDDENAGGKGGIAGGTGAVGGAAAKGGTAGKSGGGTGGRGAGASSGSGGESGFGAGESMGAAAGADEGNGAGTGGATDGELAAKPELRVMADDPIGGLALAVDDDYLYFGLDARITDCGQGSDVSFPFCLLRVPKDGGAPGSGLIDPLSDSRTTALGPISGRVLSPAKGVFWLAPTDGSVQVDFLKPGSTQPAFLTSSTRVDDFGIGEPSDHMAIMRRNGLGGPGYWIQLSSIPPASAALAFKGENPNLCTGYDSYFETASGSVIYSWSETGPAAGPCSTQSRDFCSSIKRRATVDDTTSTTILSAHASYALLGVVAGKIYMVSQALGPSSGAWAVEAVSESSGARTLLLSEGDMPDTRFLQGAHLDDVALYLAVGTNVDEPDSTTVYRVPHSTEKAEILLEHRNFTNPHKLPEAGGTWGFASDDTYLYWVERGAAGASDISLAGKGYGIFRFAKHAAGVAAPKPTQLDLKETACTNTMTCSECLEDACSDFLDQCRGVSACSTAMDALFSCIDASAAPADKTGCWTTFFNAGGEDAHRVGMCGPMCTVCGPV
jgi:hypothetical protein